MLKEALVFIRSLLFNIIYWTAFILTFIILLPVCIFTHYKTIRQLVYLMDAKLLHFLLKVLVKIKYEVIGLENINGQVIIGSMHQSTWETIAIPDIIGRTRDLTVVIKKELMQAPLIGLYMKKFRYIQVDRSSPVKAIGNLLRVGSVAANNGDSILIFVNGSRSNINNQDMDNATHKVGVYALYKNLNLPVVPCTLNSGKYWGRRSFVKHAGTIKIEFKKPIPTGLSRTEFDKLFGTSMTSSQN